MKSEARVIRTVALIVMMPRCRIRQKIIFYKHSRYFLKARDFYEVRLNYHMVFQTYNSASHNAFLKY